MLNLFKLLHYSPLPRLYVLAEQLSADAPDQSATDLLVELEKDMEQGGGGPEGFVKNLNASASWCGLHRRRGGGQAGQTQEHRVVRISDVKM